MPLIVPGKCNCGTSKHKGFAHLNSAPKTTKLFYIFAETILPRKIITNTIFAVAARHTINGYICSSTFIQRG
jgi:hypothetical protein